MFNRLIDDPVADMSTAFARAEAGAEYLDRTCGDRWHEKIDIHKVNIASPLNCILGQLMRQRHWGLTFLSLRDSMDFGFSCGLWDFLFFAQPPWVSRSFHRLTEAWKLVLEERIAQDTLPKPRRVQTLPVDHGRGDSDQNRFTCVN